MVIETVSEDSEDGKSTDASVGGLLLIMLCGRDFCPLGGALIDGVDELLDSKAFR